MMISLALLGFGMSGLISRTSLAHATVWLAYLATPCCSACSRLLRRCSPFAAVRKSYCGIGGAAVAAHLCSLPFCAERHRTRADRVSSKGRSVLCSGSDSVAQCCSGCCLAPESALRVVAGSGLAAHSRLACGGIRDQVARRQSAGIGLLILLPGKWLRIEPGRTSQVRRRCRVPAYRRARQSDGPHLRSRACRCVMRQVWPAFHEPPGS
jgi:hypothetical protein